MARLSSMYLIKKISNGTNLHQASTIPPQYSKSVRKRQSRNSAKTSFSGLSTELFSRKNALANIALSIGDKRSSQTFWWNWNAKFVDSGSVIAMTGTGLKKNLPFN